MYARPKPWLGHVGGNCETLGVPWFVSGVVEFLRLALRDMQQYDVPFRRARPLFCIPFVGAGFGGAASVVGALIGALLDAAEGVVRRCDCDIAFVTTNEVHFAAAQAIRQQRAQQWRDLLPPRLRSTAESLSKLAKAGQLALFVGAGCSMACGLPSWGQLLGELASAAGLSQEERGWLAQMSFLDQARILERRLGAGGELQAIVARMIDTDYHSLTHACLASLPVDEYITTNYDVHLERALAAIGRPHRVLPYQAHLARFQPRFVLKLHGCVNHPEGILLLID